MNKFMGILWTVTVICIIAGIIIHVGGFFGRIGDFFNTGWPFAGRGDHESASISEGYSGVEVIKLDLDCCDVRFDAGDTLNVSYDGVKQLQPKIEQSGRELKITQSATKVNAGLLKDNTLTITVPGNGVSEIRAEIDAGNIEIRDIATGTVDLSLDLGNVECTNVACGDLKVESDSGNVEIKDSAAGKVDIELDLGNIELENCIPGDLKAVNDMGNISVRGLGDLDDYKIRASCSLGNVSVNGDGSLNEYSSGHGDKKISLKAEVGNVEISE